MLRESDESVRRKIYVDGCLVILMEWLTNDVKLIIDVYSGVGIVNAVVEMVALVLAGVYVAQINRRLRREKRAYNTGRAYFGKGGPDIRMVYVDTGRGDPGKDSTETSQANTNL